ncbi:MAG: hypothetical protein DRH51_03265 [Candidatus Coatesbacteria bacterium]|nr:MAG: hypothetical protein DRH51_03265 [Candidatus Coatesbacteria bacterium]
MVENKGLGDIEELAERMVEELYNQIGPDAVEEAKAMGMATSIYASEIEKKKSEFLKQVDIDKGKASEIFDKMVSKKFYM